MNDEALNILYIEQAVDRVLTELELHGEFLTQSEKLKKIKSKNNAVYEHLMKLIDKGTADSDFENNRKNLIKSFRKNMGKDIKNRTVNLIDILSIIGGILIVFGVFTLSLESKWLTAGLVGLGALLAPLPLLYD